jgi:NAD(P)H-flavin reductase
MACGRGLCLGCTVTARDGYRLACQHGPVFDARDLDWSGA